MANLTGSKIKDTYGKVVQWTNNRFEDGLGNALSASFNNLTGSFSGSFVGDGSGLTSIVTALSSSVSTKATTATTASYVNNAKYALTSSNTFIGEQLIRGKINHTGSLSITGSVEIGQHHWYPAKIGLKNYRSEIWIDQASTDQSAGNFVFIKSRGVPGAESPALVGDNIFRIAGRVVNSGSTRTGNALTWTDYSEPVQITGTVTKSAVSSSGAKITFATQETGAYGSTVRLTIQDNGHINAVYPLSASLFVSASNVLTLQPQHPLPSAGLAAGAFAVSSSSPIKPYFYNGSTWNALY